MMLQTGSGPQTMPALDEISIYVNTLYKYYDCWSIHIKTNPSKRLAQKIEAVREEIYRLGRVINE